MLQALLLSPILASPVEK